MSAEPFPMVQLTPAELATVHRTLTARAWGAADTALAYRAEERRLAAMKRRRDEAEAWRARTAANASAKAAELEADAAELNRIAAFFTPEPEEARA